MSYQIIVHAGAGSLVDPKRQDVCNEVVKNVALDLAKGVNALDACEKAIKMIEDSPIVNSGTGAYLQLDGKIRMDACIMDSNLRLGSVVQISNVKNPISVAKSLLEHPMHCMLSGEGANTYAREIGLPLWNNSTIHQEKMYRQIIEKLEYNISYEYIRNNYEKLSNDKLCTCGCVVKDQNGLIVAGTSTGGLECCYPCRLGDSGLVGCGNYANELVGVSCTGVGEKIMRISMARLVSMYVEFGDNLATASKKAIAKLGSIGGEGGLITISAKGEIVAEFNTEVMPHAMISQS